jgi:hypothetical protein
MPEELMTLDQYIEALNQMKKKHGGDSLIFVFDRSYSDLAAQVKRLGKEEFEREMSNDDVDSIIFSINPSPVQDAINNAIGSAFDSFVKS